MAKHELDLQYLDDNNSSLYSDNDFCSGLRNVGLHYRKKPFSGLPSPGRSDFTIEREFIYKLIYDRKLLQSYFP